MKKILWFLGGAATLFGVMSIFGLGVALGMKSVDSEEEMGVWINDGMGTEFVPVRKVKERA